ncbi:hypothetical protein IU433_02520 [Nocardia puris]|uniref:hypothetical protein n=1 Tax=Nocardia puris TaxID=208602 RepID=UPI001892E9E2|nr:hypothetical protein [Nocardia puris]MBF6457921.1 hypothetical protein [Nocardia puris]
MADKHSSKVAMSRARHPGTGRILLASEIAEFGDSWPKPLACYTIGCGALVHPVAEIPRTEKTHGRAAYYARNPSRGGRPNDHSPHCVYNLTQIITVLTENSGGQLRRDRPVTNPETGAIVPVYRLPWPQTFAPTVRTAVAEATSPEGAVFAERGTKLLNTAAKIAELLDKYREMGEHPEVEFRATCNGRDVEWPNFLYTPQRTHTLARNMRRTQLAHPVAVIFRPRTYGVVARRDWAWVRADVATLDGDDGTEMLFVCGARGLVDEAFDRRARAISARMYIGFGMWSMVSRDSRPGRLTLDLIDGSLIAELPSGIDREVLHRWSAFRAVPE